MSVRYKDFKFAIRREFWPFPGEAKSLIPAHDKFFDEAMSQLQKWVPCLRQHHTSVFKACSTYLQCGLTVVGAPAGRIRRVYTIANDEWCDPVYASGRDYREVLRWQRNLMLRFTQPANEGMPALQQGYKFPEATTDSASGRARTGMWAIEREKLFYAPWIQSNESLVVEWDGVKVGWSDDDMLDETYWTPDVAAAVKLYVAKCHERDFGGDNDRLKTHKEEYAEKLGDLVYWCQKFTENQETVDAEELNVRPPTQAEVEDDAVPTEETEQVIAVIGNWWGTPETSKVATLVDSFAPKYVVTAGDNWHGNAITADDLDSYAYHYSKYIFPYNGTRGTGADVSNAFFPAMGNYDRDPAARKVIYQNYFNRPRQYYDFIIGQIHWFVLDPGYMNDQITIDQPDGNNYFDIQGGYFKVKMAVTTARWKIAVCHFPPYCSTATEFPTLRWPFKDWGIDLVINGHSSNYERLLAPEGYPIIGCGWSGRPLTPFVGVSAYSLVRYAALNGALKITASIDQLKAEAINVNGAIIDSLTLTKA